MTGRIGKGLKQLLAGSRKFKLELLKGYYLASPSERAAKVTGIPLLEELDAEEVKQILG